MFSALNRHVPLLSQLRTYDSATLQSDTNAGLTTAIMLVPQAMAYAMLAGLEPIVGLYASTVPLVVYGFLGSSRQLAVGPVAMVSLLVATGLAAVSTSDPTPMMALAALLALLVGVIAGVDREVARDRGDQLPNQPAIQMHGLTANVRPGLTPVFECDIIAEHHADVF